MCNNGQVLTTLPRNVPRYSCIYTRRSRPLSTGSPINSWLWPARADKSGSLILLTSSRAVHLNTLRAPVDAVLRMLSQAKLAAIHRAFVALGPSRPSNQTSHHPAPSYPNQPLPWHRFHLLLAVFCIVTIPLGLGRQVHIPLSCLPFRRQPSTLAHGLGPSQSASLDRSKRCLPWPDFA